MHYLKVLAVAVLCIVSVLALQPKASDIQELANGRNEKPQDRSHHGYQPLYSSVNSQIDYPGIYGHGLGLNSGHGYQPSYGIGPHSGYGYGLSQNHGYGFNTLGGIQSHSLHHGLHGSGYNGGYIPGLNSYSSGFHDGINTGIHGTGYGIHHKVPHYRSEISFDNGQSTVPRDASSGADPLMNQARSAYEAYYYPNEGYGADFGYGAHGYGSAVGVFPHANLLNAFPIYVSCQPKLIQGHIQSYGSNGYPYGHGVSAYREADVMDNGNVSSLIKEVNVKSLDKMEEDLKFGKNENNSERGEDFSKKTD